MSGALDERARPWRRIAAPCALLLAGCASVPERPRTEDDARLLAPLPACLVELEALSTKPAKTPKTPKKEVGVTRSLREEQIWALVYPGLDPRLDTKSVTVPESQRSCTGRTPMTDRTLTGGTRTPLEEGAILLGGGGDRLKVAWLRSETFADGTQGGALALVRTVDGTAEVYAVGSYRGLARTLLTIERIGPEVVVVAQSDGCAGRAAGAACETMLGIYRPRFGVLERVATIAQERIAHGEASEPGIRGRIEYRLSSAVQFVDGGIRALEQILVKDEQGREVRKAELERSFTFAPDGSMIVDEDSLWSRVAVPKAPPKPTQADAR